MSAAIDYGLAGIQSPDRSPPPTPPQLLVQARLAAQGGVGLDVVLRRYLAGYTLLCDFLVDEVRRASAQEGLRRLLRAQAARFERLIVEVGEEHRRAQGHQAERHTPGLARRRLELVRGLLDGDPLDATELGYGLEGTHLAAVGGGQGLDEALAELASRLGLRLLAVQPEEDVLWVWLGHQGQIDLAQLERSARRLLPPGARLGLGEPGDGMGGWRLTHRQACSALALATPAEPLVRYREVAVIASIRKDELLAASLKSLYLDPLREGQDEGRVAQQTLRAYFAAARNVSSTAAALGVSRQTVTTRLAAIEERLGQPIERCATEIELAIRLHSS